MTTLNGKWAVLAIVAMTLALLTAATFAGSGPVLAVKNSSTTLITAYHIKGVKIHPSSQPSPLKLPVP